MTSAQRPAQPASPISNIRDIYYVVFRHKWKIVTCSALGFVVAGVMYFTTGRAYQSEAKILLRYVRDTAQPITGQKDGEVKSADPRGENIINTEREILTSLDLAEEVAEKIGPDKILGKGAPPTAKTKAAILITKSLTIDAAKGNVIKLMFRHPEPEVAQSTLQQIIVSYRKKHFEIHRPVGIFDDFLSVQADGYKSRLKDIDEQLSTLRQKAGVGSIEESRKINAEQVGKVRQDLLAAEAELEERTTGQKAVEKIMADHKAAAPSTTNTVERPQQPNTIARYKSVISQLASYRTTEIDYLTRFTSEHPQMKAIQQQIAEAEKIQAQMEEENPELASLPRPTETPGAPAADPALDAGKITALQSKIKVLNGQLGKLRIEATQIDEAEMGMRQVMRARDIAETNYKIFIQKLEDSRIDEALGPGKISNMSEVEAATPPLRASRDMLKKLAMAIAGGIFGGLGLAFLTEIILDQSIKLPNHLTTRFNAPLFLTVPTFLLKNGHKVSNGTKVSANGSETNGKAVHLEVEPWSATHPLREYSEALRDRLVTYFHKRNMTHKPKLIGITSCSRGAGATTIAAGLAATLSETGDGNVLLVDLNTPNGASLHPFNRGKLACGLSEVLENERRTSGFVQENLYVATVKDADGKNRVVLPREITNFLPKLKASDYDYIIFDMPAVHQTSPTPRLAAMLDIVHLVVHSEKTQLEAVKQATSLLAESSDSLTFILNKTKNYLPKWLEIPA
jgi:succinoglycan biosynthesis transport protein ExoP